MSKHLLKAQCKSPLILVHENFCSLRTTGIMLLTDGTAATNFLVASGIFQFDQSVTEFIVTSSINYKHILSILSA